ncbi:MAG: GrpB family protein [Saccharofermentanales bacterium]
MPVGLKRDTVMLADHDPNWATLATETITKLNKILGNIAVDIQHVGSTSIVGIKAKPIIDIAVAVQDFDVVMALSPAMKEKGFIYRKRENHNEESLLFACGDYSQPDEIVTHFIHIVKSDGEEIINYLSFRDYMNTHYDEAKDYESLKLRLMVENPIDPGREKYIAGKKNFITERLKLARLWDDFGRKFTIIKPVKKGWSIDKKYYVETADGKHMLLRVSDISEIDRKKAEYNMMERVYELGVLTSQPLEFGLCNGDKSCYSLSGWLDGEDAESVLPLMPETERYFLGMKAGETLRKIHTLPAPVNIEPWGERFRRKMQERLDFYNTHPIKSDKGDIAVRYMLENQHLLDGRPQTFNHGDFGISNMMIMPDGQIGVIDFNYFNSDHGDPWWEFDSIPWGTEPSFHFYTGLIKGYFEGEPPSDFFKVFSYYLAYDALAALCDTSENNQGVPAVGKRHLNNILRWFDNMQNPVPTWYLKDCCEI